MAARLAVNLGFIPTTSGHSTGVAADPSHVEAMRKLLEPGDPLAIASGITPENAELFLPFVSHVLVSTGVSSSFHEFDPAKLRALVAVRASLTEINRVNDHG
jgi:predicted TIM-barrel enzyme